MTVHDDLKEHLRPLRSLVTKSIYDPTAGLLSGTPSRPGRSIRDRNLDVTSLTREVIGIQIGKVIGITAMWNFSAATETVRRAERGSASASARAKRPEPSGGRT